jgi:hypothetical protein
MKARAHDIVEIDSCPLLAASMDGALPAARAIARALAASGAPLDILVTATASGLDVDLKGMGRSMTRNGKASCGSRWNTTSRASQTMVRS